MVDTYNPIYKDGEFFFDLYGQTFLSDLDKSVAENESGKFHIIFFFIMD